MQSFHSPHVLTQEALVVTVFQNLLGRPSMSEEMKITKVNMRLTDGSHVKGNVNNRDHDRISDLLNLGQDPFIIVFDATTPGGGSGKVIFVSKSQILWICPDE
jgi:hypothetical protein